MLEIIESNSKTSNNSIEPAAAAPIVPITAAPIVPVAAAPPRPAAPAVPVAVAPPRRGARRAAGGRAVGGTSWSDRIKGVLGELVDLIAEKF